MSISVLVTVCRADPEHVGGIIQSIPSGRETARDPAGSEGDGRGKRHWSYLKFPTTSGSAGEAKLIFKLTVWKQEKL